MEDKRVYLLLIALIIVVMEISQMLVVGGLSNENVEPGLSKNPDESRQAFIVNDRVNSTSFNLTNRDNVEANYASQNFLVDFKKGNNTI